MKDKNKKLKAIFNSDQFNLLNVESKKDGPKEEDQRLIDSFQEISDFFEANGREPEENGMVEFKLFSRLQSIRNTPAKVKILIPFDFHNLLKLKETRIVEPIDIIKEDPYGIFDDTDEDLSIYNMENVKKSDRILPDYLSRRKICSNFEDYEAIFEVIHKDLVDKIRRLERFDITKVIPGNYFVLNGVLLLIEEINLSENKQLFKSGERQRKDGRTKCIFDNGTESDMLYRSLIKALEIDGFGVSEKVVSNIPVSINENDEENGFIYILKSKSNDINITSIPNLYKIGYSSGDVTNRIKNAQNEPTYLMSEVELISAYRCFNMSTHKLENTIHAFFNDVRLKIEIIADDGRSHKPREWFNVPLDIIEESINLIVDDEISEYYFDMKINSIVKK
ncbi:GIY-YIG nuclease family protein [Flavobacteriales bacterium]|nr:GIY-YIG nuclease family protein [Flavobacteriales bacterium]